MYVLQLDTTERDYLLPLLKSQRPAIGKLLASRLKTADDVFGVVMWSDDDIKETLTGYDVPATPENVESVRRSYYVRHIDDRMVECGWTVLEEAVLELRATVP